MVGLRRVAHDLAPSITTALRRVEVLARHRWLVVPNAVDFSRGAGAETETKHTHRVRPVSHIGPARLEVRELWPLQEGNGRGVSTAPSQGWVDRREIKSGQ